MKCLHCGHSTNGPWNFCFQSCADDYRSEIDLAARAEDLDPEDFESLEALYAAETPIDDYGMDCADLDLDLDPHQEYPAGADCV